MQQEIRTIPSIVISELRQGFAISFILLKSQTGLKAATPLRPVSKATKWKTKWISR